MEVKQSVSEVNGGRVCVSCHKVCSDDKNDWCYTSATECLSYDVLENDLHQDNIVCKTCHLNLLKMKTWRQKQLEDQLRDSKCSDDMTTAVNNNFENNNQNPDVENSVAENRNCNVVMDQEPVVTSNDLNTRENESTFSSPIKCNLENKDFIQTTSKETLNTESKEFTKCASLTCPDRDTKQLLRNFPFRFFKANKKSQRKLRSSLALEEDGRKLCVKCYNKLYGRLFYLMKRSGKKPVSDDMDCYTAHSKKTKTSGKQKAGNITKIYACGWCKFRSEKVDLVVLHHYKEHQNRELDVVRLKTPRARLSPGIGFKCESCDFSGQLRHQLHLHNDHFHRNAVNRDGITDYESESSYSPVYPYYFYKMTLPSNYFQMQQKYKLRDVKIACKDILRSGLDYLMERVDQEGVSKLCVDSLSEDDFISIATKYRKNVSYLESTVDNYVPVDMATIDLKDIGTIIRG